MKVINLFTRQGIFLLGVFFFACGAGNPEQKPAAVAKDPPARGTAAPEQAVPAPGFRLANLDGALVSSEITKGKVVILDFWATWCGPCIKGVPEFTELYNSLKDKGLIVVGISLDNGPEVVKKFVERYKVSYPVLMGNQKVVDDYGGIYGIPTTFIIDRQGRIVKKVVGYNPKAFFENYLNQLL